MAGNGFRPPLTLRGTFVDLIPLERSHLVALAEAGRDPAIWTYLRIGPGRTLEEMSALIDSQLALQAAGHVLAFSIVLRTDGRPHGMIRYLEVDRENRWVEAGTWIDSNLWRTPVNTEAKYLTMRYAFDEERFHRYQLRTDLRNYRSQEAIERLGARKEGVLREHLVLADGYVRSSVYYSILDSEWPAVRGRLEAKLARAWPVPSRSSPSPAGHAPPAGTPR